MTNTSYNRPTRLPSHSFDTDSSPATALISRVLAHDSYGVQELHYRVGLSEITHASWALAHDVVADGRMTRVDVDHLIEYLLDSRTMATVAITPEDQERDDTPAWTEAKLFVADRFLPLSTGAPIGSIFAQRPRPRNDASTVRGIGYILTTLTVAESRVHGEYLPGYLRRMARTAKEYKRDAA